MKNRAFTLIELLVVIAIIAILAAILFPVFAQAKLAAKKSSDLSSVKQITLSTMIYVGDTDDRAPTQNPDVNGFPDPWYAGSGKDLGYMDPTIVQCWAASIQPYMKSLDLQVSVAAPKDPNPDYGYRNKSGAGNSTWRYNGALMGKSMTSMGKPSDLIMYQGKLTTTRESLIQPACWNGGNSCNGIDLNWAGNTFGKGANYGWADGHATYKQRTAVQYKHFGMTSEAREVGGTGPGGAGSAPNTTSMSDPATNPSRWWTWGDFNLDSM